MGKRVCRLCLCVLLSVCLMISALPSAWAAAGDEIRAAKKIISVVYDDSGSMQSYERYVYANYATQALAALLNEQDELYITYMSAPTNAVEMNLRKISDTVASVRRVSYGGGTPEAAIDTAYEKLTANGETERTTQFWLVIMTDGEVEKTGGGGVTLLENELRSKLSALAGSSMSNGTALNLVYFSMGSGVVLAPDTAKGFYTYSASDGREISAEIQKLAALISGRFSVDSFEMPDESTIRFDSSLPLYSISILSQNSTAEVTSAEAGSAKLKYRNVALEKRGGLILNGNAAVLFRQDAAGKSQVIPDGSYTVHLSGPVAKDQIIIQFEPAIGMKARFSSGGQEIDDYDDLLQGDRVSVSLVPVVPGTDQEIPLSDLPAGIQWSVECEAKGKPIASASDRSLSDVELQLGEMLFRGSMQIPGFAPLIFEQKLDIQESFRNLGIEVEQPAELTYKRTDIAGFTTQEHVKYYITSDGERLTPDQLKRSGLSMQIADFRFNDDKKPDPKPVRCSLKQEADGGYILQPRAYVPFGAGFIRAGEYTAEVSIVQNDDIKAEGSFTAVKTPGDWPQMIWLLVILYLLFLLIWNLFVKCKFRRQTIASDQYQILSSGGGKHLSGPTTRTLGWLTGNFLLLPLRASKIRFQGLEIIAGEDGSIIISGRSIASRCAAYGPSTSDPIRHARSIARGLVSTRTPKGDKKAVSDRSLSDTPTYFQDNTATPQIWNIYRQK